MSACSQLSVKKKNKTVWWITHLLITKATLCFGLRFSQRNNPELRTEQDQLLLTQQYSTLTLTYTSTEHYSHHVNMVQISFISQKDATVVTVSNNKNTKRMRQSSAFIHRPVGSDSLNTHTFVPNVWAIRFLIIANNHFNMLKLKQTRNSKRWTQFTCETIICSL